MQPEKSGTGQIKIMQVVKNVSILLELAKSHGVGFILMGFFCYYIYSEKVQMQAQLNNCNTEILEIYQQQNEAFRDVVKENTEAIKTFSVFIQNHNK